VKLISTPMVFKEIRLGVVVLTCHTGKVSADMQAFIKRVVDQYAVSVNNANTFAQTQEMAFELKNQRDELEIQSRELEAASKTKSEFLANMSHELIYEEFEISTTINEVRTLVTSVAAKKNIKIDVSIAHELTIRGMQG
jgi:hypothetical protein